MFFFFSKVLTFLFSPLIWFFGLIIWSLKIKDEIKRKRVRIIAFVILYLASNSFFIDEIARAWEPVTPDYYTMNTKYDVAIVLGGIGRIDERQGRVVFGYSGDPIFQTLELYHKGRIGKIMFSGGSGSLTFPDHKEGLYVKKYLQNIHIPDSALLIEYQSKNTHENAEFSKKMLDSLKFNGSVLLVTSAFHMRRALACFKKAGFKNVTPYITNRMSGPRKFALDHCFIPSAEPLGIIHVLVHEWAGYLIYKIKGYS